MSVANRYDELTSEQQAAFDQAINAQASGRIVNPDEYNGWVNRETWAAALHLSNDEGLYQECLELVMGKLRWSAGDAIEQFVTEQVEMILFPYEHDWPPTDLWRMFISDVGSMWRVDWSDVAASFMEDEA